MERDVGYDLAAHGEYLPKLPVAALMTTASVSRLPNDGASISSLSWLSSKRRIADSRVASGGGEAIS